MRDLVPASSSAIPEPALAPLPDTLLLRSQRPFWGAAARVWIAFALIGAALIFASGALFWALIGLSVVAFFLFPALVFGLLRPVEKEVLAATPKTAPALLDALRNRRRVRLLAPFAWTAAQEGRLHLTRGDGRAAAKSFAEALRLGGLAGDPPPSLVSAQAHALLVAEAPEQAREMLQQLARRGPLGPWERLHLGIALLLGGKLRVEEAREHVDAAEQALGGHARVLAARAWLVQRAGEGEAAIAALQAAEAALHDNPDKLGQSLVERARRLLRPALKAQEKRARKHDRRGKDEAKSVVVEGTGAKGQVGDVVEGAGAKRQVASRAEVAEGAGAKKQASVVVKSEAPRAVEPAAAEATPASGIVLALGPGTSAATGERAAKGETERAKGKKKARREERRAARRAAKAERRATQRAASPARPAVRTSAPAKAAPVVEKATAAPVEKKVDAVKEPRVETPALEAGVKDRSVAGERLATVEARAAQVEKSAVEAGVKDRSIAGEKPAVVEVEAAQIEKPAIDAGAKDRSVAAEELAAVEEARRIEKPAAVEPGVKDRSIAPVAAPASVASRVEVPAGRSGAVAARPAEVAQKTGWGPARAEQAPAPPSGSALFGGLGKGAGEVVATPGVGPGRLPTLRPGATRPEAPAPVAPQRASGPIAPPMKAPAAPVPAVPKFTSSSSAPLKSPAPSVAPPVAQAPVAKPVAPAPAAPSVPGVAPPVPTAPAASAPAVQAPVAPPPVVQAPKFAASVAPPVVQAPTLAPPVLAAPPAPPVQAPTLAAPQPAAPASQGPVPGDVSGAGDAEWDALLDAFDET